MNKFLREAFEENKDAKLVEYDKVHIVMGNQSCDLDSAITAISYAYYLHSVHKQENKEPKIFVPILNIPRKDFTLKKDIQYLLMKGNVDSAHILFRDDIDFDKLIARKNLQFTLVDHHVLSSADECFKPFVTNIFDHRPRDEKNCKYDISRVRIIIKLVASCATLICEEILLEHRFFLEDNRNVAFLLYGPIILDTNNFNASVGRSTPLDFEMACVLNESLMIDSHEVFRKEMYGNLVNARTDVGDMTPLELLRIDIKFAGNIPVPGFPILVEHFLKLPDCENCLKTFCRANNADTIVLIGITVDADDVMHRDIAVYSIEPNAVHERLVESLVASQFLLNLEMEETAINGCDLFHQHNIRSSRKQIIPLIRECLMDDD